VGALAGAGVQPLAIRGIARAPRATRGILWTAFWLRAALGTASLAVAIILLHAGAMPFDTATRDAAAIFTFSVLVDGLTAQLLALFRGRQTMGIEARITSGGRIVSLVVTLAAILIAPSVVDVAVASAVGSVALFVFSLRVVARQAPPVRLRARAARVFLAHSLPFAAGGLLVYVFFRIDTLLLRFFGIAESAIGNYAAAYRVMEVTRVPSAVIAQGYGPAASRFRTKADAAGLVALASRAWSLTLAIALPSVLAFVLAPGFITGLVFGGGYHDAIALLLVMAAMPAFMAFNGVAIQTVNSQGEQRWSTAIFGLCAVVNVALNVALIPRIGATGAAVATIATEVVQTAALLTWIASRIGVPRPEVIGAAAAFAGALAAAWFVPVRFGAGRLALALGVYLVVVAPRVRRSFAAAVA
jgi:O-antigen/teichoic acid export membrane protein